MAARPLSISMADTSVKREPLRWGQEKPGFISPPLSLGMREAREKTCCRKNKWRGRERVEASVVSVLFLFFFARHTKLFFGIFFVSRVFTFGVHLSIVGVGGGGSSGHPRASKPRIERGMLRKTGERRRHENKMRVVSLQKKRKKERGVGLAPSKEKER